MKKLYTLALALNCLLLAMGTTYSMEREEEPSSSHRIRMTNEENTIILKKEFSDTKKNLHYEQASRTERRFRSPIYKGSFLNQAIRGQGRVTYTGEDAKELWKRLAKEYAEQEGVAIKKLTQ